MIIKLELRVGRCDKEDGMAGVEWSGVEWLEWAESLVDIVLNSHVDHPAKILTTDWLRGDFSFVLSAQQTVFLRQKFTVEVTAIQHMTKYGLFE